jgi:hypothetical protein
MNEDAEMPTRVRLIFRVLSTFTLVEGMVGVLITLWNIIAGRRFYAFEMNTLIGSAYPHMWHIYAISCATLPFNLMFLVAGALLWNLDRRGLFTLICTLTAEIAIFFTFVFHNVLNGAHGLSNVQGFLVGLALFPVFPQILTAFPFVAGILIFFACRYIGIPARQVQ